MARPISRGLAYTRLDISFFSDRKIRRLRRRKGGEAPLVYIAILCATFAEGYYIKWDDDLAFDLSDMTGMEENYILDVVKECLEVGLLSKEMFDAHSILTSYGIQKQYKASCEQGKKSGRIEEYSLLVSSEETLENGSFSGGNPLKTGVIPEETPEKESFSGGNPQKQGVSSEEMPQNKINKNKINKNKLSSSFPSSPCVEVVNPEQEEKEKIISFFTFSQNYISPCAEYDRMIAHYDNPFNKTGWKGLTDKEKQACVAKWHPEHATVQEHPMRWDADFLHAWRQVYDKLRELGAPWAVRMAALTDKIRFRVDGDVFMLSLPQILYEYMEKPPAEDKPSRIGEFKPFLWPQVLTHKCNSLKYDFIN